jgi:DNA-binding NtrC family response regulator
MQPTPPLKALSKLRLLIVDDDAQLADFLRDSLGSECSLVMVASGILEAKTLVNGPFLFQTVVCDYRLEDGTGLELYKWLRQERNSQVPFLMISGMVDSLAEDDPHFGFLHKPFSPGNLMKHLEQFNLS